MDKFCVKCGAELVNGVCPNCSREQTAPQYYPQQPAFSINPDDERVQEYFYES